MKNKKKCSDDLPALPLRTEKCLQEREKKATPPLANKGVVDCKTSHRNLIDYMRNGYVYGKVIYEKGRAVDFIHEEVNTGYETITGLKDVVGKKISEIFPGIEHAHPEFIEKQLQVAETGVPDRFEIYLESLKKWFDVSVYSPQKGHFVAMFDEVTERRYYEFILTFRLRILQMAENSSVESLLQTTLDEAERVTQSRIGFVFFVAKDQRSLSLQSISTNTGKVICRKKEKREQLPLDKAGIWAEAVREQRAIMHNYDPPIKHYLGIAKECEKEVMRELVVPVIRNDRIVAIMGIGNKPVSYDEKDIRWTTILANLTWDIVAKKIAETEQEKLQIQLQQAQKMEMVGQLAAGMAHEINNPLNFIAINFANIRDITSDLQVMLKEYQHITRKLEEGTLSPLDLQQLRKREAELSVEMLIDDIPEIMVESQRGFERITAVINSMRNLSHRYAIDKKIPFDINQGIMDTLIITRHEYSSCADIKTTLGELPLIPCNPEQINQVFLNLIINSVHAIQSQKRHANGTITIQTWFDSSNVYCSIADDGPGIPETIRDDIFNPFFTTKNPGKGTGLGLSISWDIIVIMHKGTLCFNTPAEGGTVFTLSLPCTTDD
jgi:two-component system, NtrC family, sensor kinase